MGNTKNQESLRLWINELSANFEEVGELTASFVINLSGEDKIPFKRWLTKDKVMIVILTIPILLTLTILGKHWNSLDSLSSNSNFLNWIKFIEYAMESLLLFILFLYQFKNRTFLPEGESKKVKFANKSVIAFFKIWKNLILSWLALYGLLLLFKAGDLNEGSILTTPNY